MKILVANRGEIAARIMRAAAELNMRTVGVFSEDDADSLHTKRADEVHDLQGTGVQAYLDMEQIMGVAKQYGCDAVHPGYGFLSENAEFARQCSHEGITFVGPDAETLEVLGDKTQARDMAGRCGVPLMPGTPGPVTLAQARAFLLSLGHGGKVMIKAKAGGGGRGMRAVSTPEELGDAYTRCQSEALGAFGNGDLFLEQLMTNARHIEVKIIGD